MSTDKKGRGPSVHNQTKIQLGKKVNMNLVVEVFEYWKTKTARNRATLDIKRERDIRWAIAVYSVQTCKEAIDGCLLSDFHMGKNKEKTVYNDVAIIFRDAAHVEKFLDLYDGVNSKSAKSKWAEE